MITCFIHTHIHTHTLCGFYIHYILLYFFSSCTYRSVSTIRNQRYHIHANLAFAILVAQILLLISFRFTHGTVSSCNIMYSDNCHSIYVHAYLHLLDNSLVAAKYVPRARSDCSFCFRKSTWGRCIHFWQSQRHYWATLFHMLRFWWDLNDLLTLYRWNILEITDLEWPNGMTSLAID